MNHLTTRAGASMRALLWRWRSSRAAARALVAVLALIVTGAIGGARAAELVMFESAACTWCERWHEELGPIYPKTAESRIAPLRRVNLHDPRPAGLDAIRGVSFTPTFVLIHNGTEIGRITGYAGDEFFWFQLGTLLEKLPQGVREGGS